MQHYHTDLFDENGNEIRERCEAGYTMLASIHEDKVVIPGLKNKVVAVHHKAEVKPPP